MIDRASDAWGAHLLDGGRATSVLINVATSLAYIAAYLGLRQASNDQWYLPAGLRFAALLVAPYRLWPALFVGDVASLSSYRVNMIPQYGLLYYAGSSVAAWPVAAMIVRQLRRFTSLPQLRAASDAVALIVSGVLAAESVSLVNKATSAYLRTGKGPMVYSDLIVYSLGHVQGIMLVTFCVMLAGVRWRDVNGLKALVAETTCAIVICGLLAAAVTAWAPGDDAALMAGRLCLLIPAVALTFRHGWRGAALAAIIANVALFATIPHQEAGQSDGAGLLMQEVFAFVSAAMFVLGARGQLRVKASSSVRDLDGEGHQRAREQIEQHERQLRAHALRAEAMQRDSRGTIEPVIAMLRQRGQSEIAMSLNGVMHTQSSRLRATVIDSIYPLTLERLGLFAALESEAFGQHFGTAECKFDLTGSPHGLSLEAQLATYRVLGEALELMTSSLPSRIHVRVRCSSKGGRGLIRMVLTGIAPVAGCRSPHTTARLAQLRNHVAAYGGTLTNRPGRMRLYVLDGVFHRTTAKVAGRPSRRATSLMTE